MRDAVASEGWPVPPDSRRVRAKHARADDPKKGERCWKCETVYGRVWVNRGVCFRCESSVRAAGACPFLQRCRDRPGSFCPHLNRCFKCDARTCCERCRVYAGDGDDVLALARTVGAAKVFLDWDRTFCTTKAGADPTKGDHSLDAALLEFAQARPSNVVVVTRSSAKAGIETFLARHHVSPDCVVRSVKKEGISKAAAIADHLEDGETGVFADDDVAEIMKEDIAADTRLHRVLFLRG